MEPGDPLKLTAKMPTLRPYEDSDGPVLVNLWYSSWHSNNPLFLHPEPVERWTVRWEEEIVPNHDIAVALDGTQVWGFCAIDIGGRYLSQLFVHPGRQGGGAGSALLDWAKTVCPQGFNLHNLVRNTRSRRFYENHGLKPGNIGLDPLSKLETIEYIWEPAIDP